MSNCETLEQAIGEVLADGAWAASAAHLQSIPGLGLVTAAWLLVGTVNFTTCASAEAAAHYAGLAPLERRRGRVFEGGRASGRREQPAADSVVHGDVECSALQPGDQKLLHTAEGGGQAGEGGALRGGSEADAFGVCSGEKRQDFDPSYQKLPSPDFIRDGNCPLTNNTVSLGVGA